MKAHKLITSINSVINEDKFSKYTLSQIYDELGEEDFVNYIEDSIYKIGKSGKIPLLKLDEKQAISPKLFLRFKGKNNIFLAIAYDVIYEHLTLRCFSRDSHNRLEFFSDDVYILKDTVNILPELQKLILRSFTDLAKERADIHI